MTANIPSYFHGWSPDGRWLAFVGERSGNFDIYRVSSTGGKEQRLTSSSGLTMAPLFSRRQMVTSTPIARRMGYLAISCGGRGCQRRQAERVTGDAREPGFIRRRWQAAGIPYVPPGTKVMISNRRSTSNDCVAFSDVPARNCQNRMTRLRFPFLRSSSADKARSTSIRGRGSGSLRL
jgi:hypothetical protein